MTYIGKFNAKFINFALKITNFKAYETVFEFKLMPDALNALTLPLKYSYAATKFGVFVVCKLRSISWNKRLPSRLALPAARL